MIYIEVMYDTKNGRTKYDQVRVPFDEVDTLKKIGVLFMIISAPTTAALSRRVIDGIDYRRSSEVWGTDNYAYLRYDEVGGMTSLLLWGWDNRSFAWVRTNDPHKRSGTPDLLRQPTWDTKINWPPWLPSESIPFEGAALSMIEWAEAAVQFNADMH